MCDICKIDNDDSLALGQLMTKSDVRVHYYCLLLSNLAQRGTDSGGILGFLLVDIRELIKDAEKRFCAYCRKQNASIQCKACSVYFHLVCGLERGCRFEFVDEFNSFCHEHHGIVHAKKHGIKFACYICRDAMGSYHPINSITASCCSTNLWVHSKCLKGYAISAGYYFTCIFCRDVKFRDEARRLGIFVPDRDAQWELEKDAFREHYQNYSKCDATICKCSHGRTYKTTSKWKIFVCHTCGTSGKHKPCSTVNFDENHFQCDACHSIFNKTILAAMEKSATGNISSSALLDKSLYMAKSQTPGLEGLIAQSCMRHEFIAPASMQPTSLQLEPLTSSHVTTLASSQPMPTSTKSGLYLIPDENDKSQLNLADFEAGVIVRKQPFINDEWIYKIIADILKSKPVLDKVVSVSDDNLNKPTEENVTKSNGAVPKPLKLGDERGVSQSTVNQTDKGKVHLEKRTKLIRPKRAKARSETKQIATTEPCNLKSSKLTQLNRFLDDVLGSYSSSSASD